MIDVEDLIALVRNYNPRCNTDLIRKAYAYGMKMHDGQMRKSGEPYFTHPVAVAAILTEQRLDDATIWSPHFCTTRSRIPGPPMPRLPTCSAARWPSWSTA
jgi:hypothetical protein